MDYSVYTVNNIRDYLDWILQSRKTDFIDNIGQTVSFEHSHLYYRGQSNKEWRVTAGVYREPFGGVITEHELLKMSALRLWKELSLYSSYLDKLVFLQHYGMKTRLIDVTYNPLVALFFACSHSSADNESDGIVYCGYMNNNDNEKIAELSAEYIFTHTLYNIDEDIKEFSKKHKTQLWEFSKPLLLLPPFNNERIENQKGAFIMSPLICMNGDTYITAFEGDFDNHQLFANEVAIIPYSCKSELLKELHTFGINRGTVFVGVSEKIESIIQEKLWDIEKVNQIKFE